MANDKDFKVKKGLVVTENILAQGNIQLVDSLGNTLTLVDSSNNVIVAGSIIGPSTLTIDPAAVGDATGLVKILGNLQVDGTTTSINSTTLDVTDKNITIAKNAADAAAANGAGLTIDGASATLTYANTGDKFVFNKSVQASSFLGAVTGNIVGNVQGNVTGTVSDISNHSTSNLSEGTNLYYTDARADARVDAGFTAKSTTNLSEGTNLYHTTARARSSISGDKGISYNSSTGVIDVDSTNITSIARGAVSASGALTYNAATGQFSFVSGQSGLIDSSLAQGMIDSNFNNIDSLNVTGTITAGTINASNITGDGSGLTGAGLDSALIQQLVDSNLTNGRNVTLGNVAGTLTTAAQTNITSVGTLGSLSVSGTSSLSGLSTIGGAQFTGNITPTSGQGVEIFVPNATSGQIQSFDRTGGHFEKLILKGNIVELNHAGTVRLVTSGTGVDVTGNIVVSGTVDGVDIAALNTTVGTKLANVVEDTTPQLGGDLASNGNNISMGDNDELRIGAGNDIKIFHNTTESRIENHTGILRLSGTDIRVNSIDQSKTSAFFETAAGVTLQYNGSQKFETTTAGINVTGNIVVSGTVDGVDIAALNTTVSGKLSDVVDDTTPQLGGDLASNGNNINIADGDLLQIGTGNDLQIYHQSNVTYLKSTNTAAPIRLQAPAGEIMGDFIPNAGVELYYDGTKKIETTSAGATVTGALTVSGDLTINGTTTTINSTTLDVDDLNITVAKGAGSAAAANGAGLTVDGASATLLYQNTGDKWVFNKPLEATSFTGNLTTSTVDINGGAIDGTNIGASTPGTGAFTTLTGNTVGGFSHLSAVGGGGTIDVVVTVASKTAAHRYNGTGSGSGYVLDGVQAPYLTLTPGRTYKFKQDDNSNSGHPFRFYYDAAKTTAYTTNVTTNLSAGQSGSYTQIVVDENTPPVLFYQCSAHGYMGNAVRMGTRNNTGLTTDGLTEGSTNLYYTTARQNTDFDTRFGTKSTANLTENTNLYYTNARADARIAAANLSDLNNVTGVPSTGQILSWNGSNWVPADDAGGLDSALTKQLIDSAHIGKINLGDLNNVATTAPSSGQVLKWNGSAWAPAADATGGGGGGGSQNLFSTIAVSGQSDVVADATTDTLTLVAGSNMTITTNAGSDTITFASTGGGGGSSLTVQDEGSALSTAATTLNFVGSGVTASGTGATKTITISGGGGGSGTVDSAGTITLIQSTVDSAYVQLRQTSGGSGVDSAATINLIDSDYVQARMLGINSSKITEFKYVADSGQTVFSGNDANGNALAISSTNHEVYLNGIRLLNDDFSASPSANSITVAQGLDSADELVIVTQGSLTTNDRFVVGAGTQRFFFNADSGQTAFTGNDKHGNALTFDSGQVDVYLNGILLTNEDVIQNGTTNTITLTSAADSDDDLAIIAYNATLASEFTAGTGTLNTFKFTLSNAQTLVEGGDQKGNTLSYVPGNELVFLNGLLLQDSDDYVTTSTTVITLTSGANANDELVIQDYASMFSGNTAGIINPEFKEFKYIADSGDTVFSGNDASGQALALTSNNFEVFLNGIRLLKSDYVANTTANSITLQGFTAADSDEVIINTIVGNVRFNGSQAVSQIVDSAYVAARTAAGTDSASVISLINSTVDEAYITRHSLDSSLALQLLLDSSEIIDLIDSAYVNARVSTVDSAQVLGIVDSAYIQTAVPASYIQANQTNFLDSALTSQLIDSNYVNSKFDGTVDPKFTDFLFTVDSGTTTITGLSDAGDSLSIGTNNFSVFLNGIKLQGTDFVDSSANNRITLNNALDSADEILVQTVTSTRTSSLPAILGTVDSAYIQQRLTEMTPATSTFSTFRYVSTEGQSVYTGNDAGGSALSYDSAQVQVFLNGLLLTKTEDFSLQNKNQLTLLDSVNAGSELVINNYATSFRAREATAFDDSAAVTNMIDSAYVQIRATGGGVTYNAASSNITLEKGNAYIVDTSSARTLTLPASAVLGDEIKVIDGTGQANTNNITINRNSHKIQGLTDNLVINVNRAAQGLVYYNAAQGWILSEN